MDSMYIEIHYIMDYDLNQTFISDETFIERIKGYDCKQQGRHLTKTMNGYDYNQHL